MSNNSESTTKFKVDISELKKTMQEAKRSIAVANSEFKAAASSMDDWSKSTDGIEAKLNQLDATLKGQKSILSSLETQYKAVVEEQGAGSKAAQDLEIKINNQKAAVNKTEKEIGNYEESLKEVSKAEKLAAISGKDVSDVLKEMEEDTKKTEGGFTVLKGAIATFVGNAMSSFVDSVKNGISTLVGLSDETREYRTEMGKLKTAFTTANFSTKDATKTYKELQSILGDEGQAVEAASHLAKLTQSEKDLQKWTNIAAGIYGTFGASLPIEGLTEAANETAKVGQVTGPLADALNWATMSSKEWNSVLQSNPKAMEAFNKGIKEGESQEDAFNRALSKCSTEQERQQLIMMSLNAMYSEAATKYKSTNKSVIEANKANSDFSDSMATLGARVEPITTSLKNGFNRLLQKLIQLTKDVDVSAFTSAISDAFSTVIDKVIPAVLDGFGWIINNKDTLISGLAGIASGFLAFKVAGLITSVVNAFKAFKAANEGATIAQWLFNAAMNANPIMLIVTIIATVIGAIVTFIATNDDARAKFMEIWQSVKDFFVKIWDTICKFFTETIPKAFKSVVDWFKNNWDTLLAFIINPFAGLFKYFYENNSKFKEFVDNAINAIKELPGKVWDWLVKVVTKINDWHKNMIAKAIEAGSSFVTNVVNFVKSLPSNIWNFLSNVVKNVATWGVNLANKGKEAAKNLFNSIVGKIKELPGNLLNLGKNIVEGLWNGINNMSSWIGEKIKSFGDGVLNGIKDFFGINSPSRVMRDQVGKHLATGVAEGIEKNSKYAKKSAEEMGDIIVKAAKNKAEKYKNQNKLTLADEVAYWNKIRHTVKKGTDARAEADKQYYDKKKELNEKLKELEEQYQSDTSEIYTQLMEDIDELTSKYEDSVESRANSITSSLSLFDGVEIDDPISKSDLQTNLNSQVTALKEWDTILTQLSTRSLNNDLMAELQSMGVESLSTLKELNSMSDAELAVYNSLYEQKEAIARERSEKENADLKAETEKQIQELTEAAKTKLSALKATYKADLKELGVVLKSDSVTVGKDLVNGIKKGIEDNKEYFTRYVKKFFKNTVKVAKKALKIKSPSRVFANEIGKWIPKGIAVGIDKNAKSALNSMRDLTLNAVGVAKDNLSGVSGSVSTAGSGGRTTNNNFYQTINAPKQLTRLEVYRQTKNLLGFVGGGN